MLLMICPLTEYGEVIRGAHSPYSAAKYGAFCRSARLPVFSGVVCFTAADWSPEPRVPVRTGGDVPGGSAPACWAAQAVSTRLWGFPGAPFLFPGEAGWFPGGEAGLTAYAQLVLYRCMGGGWHLLTPPLAHLRCALCLGCPPGCLSHDPVCLLCSVGMGRGKRVLWIEQLALGWAGQGASGEGLTTWQGLGARVKRGYTGEKVYKVHKDGKGAARA